MDELLAEDVELVVGHFQSSIEELHRSVRKPNILLCGAVGAGKSAILASVFGLDRSNADASVDRLKQSRQQRRQRRGGRGGSAGSSGSGSGSGSGIRSSGGLGKRSTGGGGSGAVDAADVVIDGGNDAGEVVEEEEEEEEDEEDKDSVKDVPGGVAFSHSWADAECEFFHRFESESLVLYDSRGLSAANEEAFVAACQRFRELHAQRTSASGIHRRALQDTLHAVWYVKDATQPLRGFEEDVIRDVFADLPVLVLLNKRDLASAEQLDALTAAVNDLHAPSVAGIFEVECDPAFRVGSDGSSSSSKDTLAVPAGGGQQRQRLRGSEDAEGALLPAIQRTMEVLPEVEAEAFLTAQRVSFEDKDRKACSIIKEFDAEFTAARTTHAVQVAVAKMITRLSVLWNFRLHGNIYGTNMAKDVTRHFGLRDRVFLLLHNAKKEEANRFYAVAFGILWNASVRKLNKRLVKGIVHEMAEGARTLVNRIHKDAIQLDKSQPLSPLVLLRSGEVSLHHSCEALERASGGMPRSNGAGAGGADPDRDVELVDDDPAAAAAAAAAAEEDDLATHINESFSYLTESNCDDLIVRLKSDGVQAIVEEETLGAKREHLERVHMVKTWSHDDVALAAAAAATAVTSPTLSPTGGRKSPGRGGSHGSRQHRTDRGRGRGAGLHDAESSSAGMSPPSSSRHRR